MEWVVIWLLFGVASSYIALYKNENGCFGFILGMLFGPMAFFLLFFPVVSKKSVRFV